MLPLRRAAAPMLVALLLPAWGNNAGVPPPAPAAEKTVIRDVHSYANTRDFVTQRLVLDLGVDFERKVIEGTAELRLKRLNEDAAELVLDTRALQIEQVETAAGSGPWSRTAHRLDPPDKLLGSALRIVMPARADRVRVTYRSSPEASGLQWLAPEQTAGRQQPFLFSQSQSIHARSWIPLQDTPMVRAPYQARIRTPKPLRALMSAANEPGTPRDGEYHFEMPQPVPSYLLAIAVGDLGFAATGRNTGVYAEPATLAAAAKEFEDTPKMLEQAESLYGPYRWGRYDLLILPPSFPYGGMENPRLTFATPTIIAGDKSLVALVAHELAHSWSGNLVTNATWRDFWLNEGFTSYFTHRIMEAVYGRERADMERVLEADELRRGFDEVPVERRAAAPAQPPPDPDDTPAVIVYNRGSLFLYNLELAFGRPLFDAFLKSWFDEHAFTSQTTEAFVDFLDRRLLARHPGRFPLEKVRAWIYDAALPADAVYPVSDAFKRVDEARSAWLEGRLPAGRLGAAQWNMLHWSHFLDNMPEKLERAQLAELDRSFALSASRNPVLLASWLPVAVRNGYEPADEAVQRHLTSTGRMLLIRPVYRALVQTPQGRRRAEAIYAQARPGYHPIARAAVERLLAEPGR